MPIIDLLGEVDTKYLTIYLQYKPLALNWRYEIIEEGKSPRKVDHNGLSQEDAHAALTGLVLGYTFNFPFAKSMILPFSVALSRVEFPEGRTKYNFNIFDAIQNQKLILEEIALRGEDLDTLTEHFDPVILSYQRKDELSKEALDLEHNFLASIKTHFNIQEVKYK